VSRLAFVWPMPSSAPTAAAIRLLGFERAAGRLGVQATSIVPRRGPIDSRWEGVPVIPLPLYGSSAAGGKGFLPDLLRMVPSTVELARTLKGQQVSCVMASTPAPFIPMQALLAAKLLGISFVLDVRDSWEMESVTHEGRLRNWVKERLERLCSRSADRVLCVTPALMNRLVSRYSLPSGRVEVVPNGADLSLFHPGPVPRDLDFVFLGSLSKYRNVEQVLESLARVRLRDRPITAHFAGSGDVPGTAEVRAMALAKGLPETVRFVPSVPHENTPRILRRARLGIVSLSFEDVFRAAIGAKTYEYIACGVPLACLGPPGNSELREFVESQRLGFYVSSPDEFAAQATTLLTDQQEWAEVSTNCIVASRRFDRRVLSEKALRNLVVPLMNGRAGNGGPSRR